MAPTKGAVRPALRWACGALAGAIAFLVVFVPARLESAVDDVVRATLAEARGEAAVARVSLPVAASGEPAASVVPEILVQTIGQGHDDALVVHRTVQSAPVRVDDIRSVLQSADTVDSAELIEGRWPQHDTETALARELADATGAAVGGTVRVGDDLLTVSGVWAPAGGRDAPWLRSPPTSSGQAAEPIGAAVVTAAALAARAGADAVTQWTAELGASQADPASLRALPAAWRSVPARLREAGVMDADLGGALVRTAQLATARGQAIATTAPLSLGIALLVAAAVAGAFVPALLAAREERRALMWARGAATGRLARDAVAELAVAAVSGAVAGAAAGAALTWTIRSPGPALTGAAVAVAGTVLVLAGVAAVLAAVDARRRTVGAGRRATALAVVFAALAVWCAVAALSSWQLLLYGSVGTAEGGVDAVAAAAPALALIALVGLGVAALWFVRVPVERAARRARGARRLVVARGIFARGVLSIVPLAVCALAAGHLIFAAGFAVTWAAQADADALARWGAPLRVAAPAGVSPEIEERVAATAGVGETAPVWTRSLSVAAESVTTLAVAGPAVATLSAAPPEEGARWAAALAPDDALGVDASDGAVAVALTGSAAPRATGVRAVFLDDFGCIRATTASVVAGAADVLIPAACHGAPRLVAVDVTLAEGAGDGPGSALLGLTVAGAAGEADLGGWGAVDPDAAGFELGDARAAVTGTSARIRFRAPVPAGPLPLVVSRGFVSATGVAIGDRVRLALTAAAEETDARVALVIDAIPGAGAEVAVMVDSRPLALAALALGDDDQRPAALWVKTPGPPAPVAASLRDALPPQTAVDGTAAGGAGDLLADAPRTVWVGALGSAVLAALGIAGVLVARRARLVPERDALRTSGATSRDIAAAARREFAVLGVAGVGVGLAAGLLVVALLCPPLARGAGGGLTAAVGAAIDPLPATAAVAGLLAAVSVAALVAGGRRGGAT